MLHKRANIWNITMAIIAINLLASSKLHSQQFNRNFQEITSFSEKGIDSLKHVIKKRHIEADINRDTAALIRNLILLSTIERISLDYSSSFDHAGEALFIAEEFEDLNLKAKANEEFGILNFLFKQDDIAGYHFRKSHNYNKLAFQNSLIPLSEMYGSYYNMLLYYQRISDYDMTEAYIDSCSALSDDIMHNVFLNEKKAFVLYNNEQYTEALSLLQNSINTLESFDKTSQMAFKNRSFLIILYSVMAKIYWIQKKGDLAKLYFEKSINEQDNFGEHAFYKAYVYKSYASVLNDLGEYKKAFENLQIAEDTKDTYLNPRNEDTQGFLSVKNRYREELRKKDEELNQKNLKLAENKQDILRFRIFFFISISLIILVGFIIRSKIQSLKHQKEKDLNKRQQQQAKELLNHKNKELTSNMLQLIEKEEIIKKLSSHLKKYQSDSSTKALLTSIEKQSAGLWESFNNRFMELNEDFYKRLKAKVPDLSSADLKICALIKLNFSGKEMAYLLGISAGSVNVARHRLRKKMNIERELSLIKFINSI